MDTVSESHTVVYFPVYKRPGSGSWSRCEKWDYYTVEKARQAVDKFHRGAHPEGTLFSVGTKETVVVERVIDE